MNKISMHNPRLDWITVQNFVGDTQVGYSITLLLWDEVANGLNWFNLDREQVSECWMRKCPFNEPYGAYPLQTLTAGQSEELHEMDAISHVLKMSRDEQFPCDISDDWTLGEEESGSYGVQYSWLEISPLDDHYRIRIAELFRSYEDSLESINEIRWDEIDNDGINGKCEILVPKGLFDAEYRRVTQR